MKSQHHILLGQHLNKSDPYLSWAGLRDVWGFREQGSGSQKNKSPWVVHTEHEHAISIVQIEYESY